MNRLREDTNSHPSNVQIRETLSAYNPVQDLNRTDGGAHRCLPSMVLSASALKMCSESSVGAAPRWLLELTDRMCFFVLWTSDVTVM